KRSSHLEVLKSKFPGFYFHTDKLSGTVNDIYGNALEINGNNPVEKSQQCMTSLLSHAGIRMNDWQLVRNTASSKADFVDYQQYLNGHKVLFSRLGFRFNKDGRITRVVMRNYENIPGNLLPA